MKVRGTMSDLLLNQSPDLKENIVYFSIITGQLTKCINCLVQLDSEILYLRALAGMGPMVSKLSGQVRGVIVDLSEVVKDIEYKEPEMVIFARMTSDELSRYRLYSHEQNNAAQAFIGWFDLRKKLVEDIKARGQN